MKPIKVLILFYVSKYSKIRIPSYLILLIILLCERISILVSHRTSVSKEIRKYYTSITYSISNFIINENKYNTNGCPKCWDLLHIIQESENKWLLEFWVWYLVASNEHDYFSSDGATLVTILSLKLFDSFQDMVDIIYVTKVANIFGYI